MHSNVDQQQGTVPEVLHRLAVLTAAASLVLITAGALVTSTGSGLAIPDWPLAYGRLLPPLVGGIRFEYAHRVIAGGVGLLTLLLVAGLWIQPAPKSIRRLALGALGLLLAQALLGGITVLRHLPPQISIVHAILGQTFFALSVALAWFTSREKGPGPFSAAQAVLTGALYLELVLGAILRHTGQGIVWHIGLALAIVGLVGWLIGRAVTTSWPRERTRPLWWIGALLGLQLGLGVATYVITHGPNATGRAIAWQAVIPSMHLAIGALILAISASLTLQAVRFAPFHISHFTFNKLSVYLELTKPRLTGLAVLTVLAGWYLGSTHPLDGRALALTLIGSALVGGGANAWNQVIERDADAQMRRTQSRPIPSGRVSAQQAARFGTIIVFAGLAMLLFAVNALATLVAIATVVSYLFCYTPLKRQTPLCTLVGAIPGALPPLIGWAAARGSVNLQAWTLFLILFLWQLPHFLAIAWKHREDYLRAGFKMLPGEDPLGASTARQILLASLAMIPASLAPTMQGLAGTAYFVGALALGAIFLILGWETARTKSTRVAHRLFLASILYLPLLLTLMAMNKIQV